ncbi:MAG TPA: alkaline phosphatase family protein [Gammaproteobacteria bacterium]
MTSFPRPDYQGASLVNLMASLRGALGAPPSDYPEAGLLPAAELRRARRIVLLLIDGLGHDFLLRQPVDCVLRRHLRGRLDSVFPTTTAAAVTAVATGVGPQQHAITGWFMWLRELGMVTSILPFRSRAGGLDLARAGLSVEALLGAPSLCAGLDTNAAVLSPQRIVESAFSRASTGPARRIGYQDIDDLFTRMTALITAPDGPQYIYAYWPEFDSLAHAKGVGGVEAQAHFELLDRACGEFLERIAGTDTCVLITADHGFIDTGPEHYVHLAEHPDLAACLRMPLCGEPRAAYCYVRPDRAAVFERYAADVLEKYCDCVPGAELIEQGLFGLGAPHPELAARVGDYVLLMKDRYVLKDYVAGEKPFFFAGVHSGLSEAELRIPLVVAYA